MVYTSADIVFISAPSTYAVAMPRDTWRHVSEEILYSVIRSKEKSDKWSLVGLEGFYGCVDSNGLFCVLHLSSMGRFTKVLEEYTGCTCSRWLRYISAAGWQTIPRIKKKRTATSQRYLRFWTVLFKVRNLSPAKHRGLVELKIFFFRRLKIK